MTSAPLPPALRHAAAGALAGAAAALLAVRFLRPAAIPAPPLAPSASSSVEAPLSSSPRPAPTRSAEVPPAPSGPSPASSLALAAAGDLGALKLLESADEASRSIDEARAIAEGRALLARHDLAHLARSIAETPALAHDRATLSRLNDFVEKEAIALDALTEIARLPGPESLDLLHAVWRRHRHTTVGLFARDLLRRSPALEQASSPLELTVEIERQLEARPDTASRVDKRCERLLGLLARVEAEGDKRCVPLLAELDSKSGCGPASDADCFACLREGDALGKARDKARTREAPAPWALARTPR